MENLQKVEECEWEKAELGAERWQQAVFGEKSQMREVGLDGTRLRSMDFSSNWNELRMVNLLRKYYGLDSYFLCDAE